MKYFSLFSGIGGFELGIHSALGRKAACVGFSEIDRHAIHVYTQHFPKHKNIGDVTAIKEKNLPDFDLLVGGFPCQSFSIAGKRKGFNDPRGQMFYHIERILRAKQPARFVLENVTGLLSHDGGRTFKIIIAALAALGYRVEWRVLNSKDFGVPQHRERVYIVGHRGKRRRKAVFPLKGTDTQTHRAPQSPSRSGIRCLYDGGYSNNRIFGTDGCAPALLTSINDLPKIAVTNSSTREFKWIENLSPALCANDSKNRKLIRIKCRIRRLTPTECERLQGFPDGWTQGISESQRHKCLGNAVTVPVISWIAQQIFKKK